MTPLELEQMTLDQILIVMLPEEALGATANRNRKVTMDIADAAAAGCDLSKIFASKSKVKEILERRKRGESVVDGRLRTKQEQREERRLALIRQRQEQVATAKDV